MSEENTNSFVKVSKPVNDLLMKPFALGWTREIVRRVVTNNKAPNCDIYYFSPNKKKLRSLAEVKSNLTDGLSLECFSFKRESLGLSSDLETIRDAKVRGKKAEKFKEKRQVLNDLKSTVKLENSEQNLDPSVGQTKSKKQILKKAVESESQVEENEERLDSNFSDEKVKVEKDVEKVSKIKTRKAKPKKKKVGKGKNLSTKEKTQTKAQSAKATEYVRLKSVKKRKAILKNVMNAKQVKQTKGVSNRKLLKEVKNKRVTSLSQKLSKPSNKKSSLISNKTKSLKLKAEKDSLKSNLTKVKNEETKETKDNGADKNYAITDLKSIVKKNIGKYREAREKQKLRVAKTQARNLNKNIIFGNASRPRSEPLFKNNSFYLKPIEKGWRRELVYRTNCSNPGQKADVYYFHPSGRKLRSRREIAENLTHGLSIECFTFRKEPIGCGEPSEVVRNARFLQRN